MEASARECYRASNHGGFMLVRLAGLMTGMLVLGVVYGIAGLLDRPKKCH